MSNAETVAGLAAQAQRAADEKEVAHIAQVIATGLIIRNVTRLVGIFALVNILRGLLEDCPPEVRASLIHSIVAELSE